MRLLDLFCGAGGAAMGYHRAGFEDITGIDIAPQPHYPFKFIQADALEYLAEHGSEYDVIHASPPCQHYSIMQNIKKNQEEKPDLLGPTRDLLRTFDKPYIIENVMGAPLRANVMLCGSFFRLGMIRHRWFECSWPLFGLFPPCDHSNMYDPWHWGNNQRVEMALGMGIDWEMTREEVREAIPPAYTEWIGKQLIKALTATTADLQIHYERRNQEA